MEAYIDVRGPWPVLVHGQCAIELRDCKRGITVEEAVKHLLGDEVNATDLDVPFTTER